MSKLLDHYVKKYDSWYDANKFVYQSELNALNRMLPKKGEGLEIGVGTGRFAAPLGIKYGIDPSKQMLEVAKSRGVEVKLGYGEDLPFEDSTFDYVVAIVTLCFVKDPYKVLTEARRVLRKSGKIVIGIVDKDSFLGRFYQRKKSVFYKQAHFFRVKEIVDLLRNAGFKRISYLQTLFCFPEDMKSIDSPRSGFGKGGFVIIKGLR